MSVEKAKKSRKKRKEKLSKNELLYRYELANIAYNYQSNVNTNREYRQHKKIQRKFAKSNGWKAYCV